MARVHNQKVHAVAVTYNFQNNSERRLYKENYKAPVAVNFAVFFFIFICHSRYHTHFHHHYVNNADTISFGFIPSDV